MRMFPRNVVRDLLGTDDELTFPMPKLSALVDTVAGSLVRGTYQT